MFGCYASSQNIRFYFPHFSAIPLWRGQWSTNSSHRPHQCPRPKTCWAQQQQSKWCHPQNPQCLSPYCCITGRTNIAPSLVSRVQLEYRTPPSQRFIWTLPICWSIVPACPWHNGPRGWASPTNKVGWYSVPFTVIIDSRPTLIGPPSSQLDSQNWRVPERNPALRGLWGSLPEWYLPSLRSFRHRIPLLWLLWRRILLPRLHCVLTFLHTSPSPPGMLNA